MSKSKTPQFPEVITHTDQLLREHHLLLLAPTDSSRHPILIDWETDKPASNSRVRKYVQGWMDDPGFPDHEVIEPPGARPDSSKHSNPQHLRSEVVWIA
jgi:hypothetical protein